MSGDTHAAVGAATALMIAGTVASNLMYSSKDSMIVGAGVAAIGAIFADLDSAKSKGNQLLNKVLITGISIIVLLFLGHALGLLNLKGAFKMTESLAAAILFLGIALIARTRPHREMTHSFTMMAITTLCVYCMFSNSFWIWYAIGYVSHLIIDYPNDKGECLLWPLPKRYCLHLCSANGTVNTTLKWLATVVIGVCLVVF